MCMSTFRCIIAVFIYDYTGVILFYINNQLLRFPSDYGFYPDISFALAVL
jgi:hypothetical protein